MHQQLTVTERAMQVFAVLMTAVLFAVAVFNFWYGFKRLNFLKMVALGALEAASKDDLKPLSFGIEVISAEVRGRFLLGLAFATAAVFLGLLIAAGVDFDAPLEYRIRILEKGVDI